MVGENRPFEAIALTPIRKVIAARMSEAKQTIPHFRVAADIELDALAELRAEALERSPGDKLSLNDFFIRACALALIEVPALNVQWADTEIHQYAAADISVVMALPGGGLSTPVIRRADRKSVRAISREVKELAARASRNALRMDDILGGTFSISNLGMHCVDQFDAIINPPQCAILAIGTAKPQIVPGQDGQVRLATMMRATLSSDHRAIDGATAAAFLSALRRLIESPDGLRRDMMSNEAET